MRKIKFLALLFFLILLTGCLPDLSYCYPGHLRMKKERLAIYNDNDNYITLTGKVVELNDDSHPYTLIDICWDNQNDNDNKNIRSYWIFSNYIPDTLFIREPLDINVGDVITYTTTKEKYRDDDWFPIVEVIKNNETLLSFEDGKQNIINWVNQLGAK